jgi:hypothetical protein
MRPARPLAVAFGVAAGAVVLALPAAAAPPTHSSGYVDSTKTFPAGQICSFPIVRHMYGTESETVKTMNDGTVRDRFYVEDYTYTLTNPATGQTVSSKEGGQFTIFEYADGTQQIVITGNDALFTAPHTGFIAGQNGRYVETDYPDGTATVDVATGHFDTGFDQALCDALS